MSEENNNIKFLLTGTGKTTPLSPQEVFESLTADELMVRLCEVSCDSCGSFYRNYALTLIEPVLHVAKALSYTRSGINGQDFVHASITKEGVLANAITQLTEAIEQSAELKSTLLSEQLVKSIDKCQQFLNDIDFNTECHAGVGATVKFLLVNSLPVSESYSVTLSKEQLESDFIQLNRIFLPTRNANEDPQDSFAGAFASKDVDFYMNKTGLINSRLHHKISLFLNNFTRNKK